MAIVDYLVKAMEDGLVRVTVAYDDVNLRVTAVSYVNDSDFAYSVTFTVVTGSKAGRTRTVNLPARSTNGINISTTAAQRLALTVINGRPNLFKQLRRVG